jgi:hypothetical protein
MIINIDMGADRRGAVHDRAFDGLLDPLVQGS